jgi:hypothetical protein
LSEVDKKTRDHTTNQKKTGDRQHSKSGLPTAEGSFFSEVGRKSRRMSHKTMAGQKATDVQYSRLKSKSQPHQNISSLKSSQRTRAMKHNTFSLWSLELEVKSIEA